MQRKYRLLPLTFDCYCFDAGLLDGSWRPIEP